MKKQIISALLIATLTVPALASAARDNRSDYQPGKSRQEEQKVEQKRGDRQKPPVQNQGPSRYQQTQRKEKPREEVRYYQTQRKEKPREEVRYQQTQRQDKDRSYLRDERNTRLNYSGSRDQWKHRDDRNDRDHRDWRDNNKHRTYWSSPVYHTSYWRKSPQRYHSSLPFSWRQNYSWFASRYRMERIYDREWYDRYPGMRIYRWHDLDGGFWYRGHRIRQAVMFYSYDGELVGVGFMFNGVFIVLRDDDFGYEHRDSFYAGWWNRHIGITIRL